MRGFLCLLSECLFLAVGRHPPRLYEGPLTRSRRSRSLSQRQKPTRSRLRRLFFIAANPSRSLDEIACWLNPSSQPIEEVTTESCLVDLVHSEIGRSVLLHLKWKFQKLCIPEQYIVPGEFSIYPEPPDF